ncbi:hypothetical protein H4Q26_008380 [Puccinia striiformis f. sp. tritici PST-130]|nr:hypothetical protein H4Q26_008380 [Puccinia striiformis f. sp. tritici PST-130]
MRAVNCLLHLIISDEFLCDRYSNWTRNARENRVSNVLDVGHLTTAFSLDHFLNFFGQRFALHKEYNLKADIRALRAVELRSSLHSSDKVPDLHVSAVEHDTLQVLGFDFDWFCVRKVPGYISAKRSGSPRSAARPELLRRKQGFHMGDSQGRLATRASVAGNCPPMGRP